ncbi:MAG: type VI secretion system baseplate subunit TssF, partial [Burkholderiaceae bacterium]|nr:type VI secretion system baseplate subunit TssF [Burkholderiaceae bacterium]
MEKLLPFYERELSLFNRNMVEFARRYPKTAGKLMIAEGQCEDPHTQHLIQSFALLTARVAKQIEDSYPQFTESLLETNHPHYLRPFPSCSIVRVEPGAADAPVATLRRGAIMQSAPVRGVPCKFSTVYNLTLAPLRLAAARFDAIIAKPASLRLPAGATSSISIVIE